MQQLDELRARPDVVALRQLASIWGVGNVTAKMLYAKGYTGVADLRASEVGIQLLTAQQRVGLRHHEELQQRMPREEAAAIGAMVGAAAEAVCPGCFWQIVVGRCRLNR